MTKALATIIAFGAFLLPATAMGQDPDPDEFTPTGYEFCGWKDLTEPIDELSWTLEWEDSLAGAFLNGFARNMSCGQAQRNIDATNFKKTKPYAPYRRGYRCVRIENRFEYSDTRCTKRGGKATYRFRSGS